ncbi:MAG: sodium:proton antiporter [Proteobacteria bacterium]|nr:sodium:proton antiporter [Pseudomonadota bacterium]MBU1716714.1 sodium:proton antiporter [Pseudomonadota bacterium]
MIIKSRRKNKRRPFDPILLLVLLLTIGLTALLIKANYTIPVTSFGLAAEVARFQPRSGVESPVTAVLLNFRGYDTLLEVMILLIAVIGVWSLTKAPFPQKAVKTSPVQLAVVRLLAPLMCLVAAYLVWQGSHLAGGAFQGGAILGGAGVLLLVAELPWLRTIHSRPLRIGLLIGPLFFLGVALLGIINGRELLTYPGKWSGSLLLLIESTCAVSIGLTLASLFAGGRPADDLIGQTKTPACNREQKRC